jgi:CDP-glucose 4,6-dehydratase
VIFSAFEGKRVLVTGHTGFKGSWLSLWLARSGAEVVGYARDPVFERGTFVAADVAGRLHESVIGDTRDVAHVREVVERHRPEVVFHLAAQPLVQRSYEAPAETFEVNVVGAANVLDAVLACGSTKATVVITSDKCYVNQEWAWGYRETDTLGGHDPYSASKAALELLVASYRSSYFAPAGMALASTRAGNVIGGGDWSADRIVPDAVRAFEAGLPLRVRNPASTRPWQHVLEPLGGYLLLAANMLDDPVRYSRAFNFGPDRSATYDVARLCALAGPAWGDGRWEPAGLAERLGPEAGLLALDSSYARHELGWSPVLSVEQSVEWAIGWYRHRFDGRDMRSYTVDQIAAYEAMAAERWRRLPRTGVPV